MDFNALLMLNRETSLGNQDVGKGTHGRTEETGRNHWRGTDFPLKLIFKERTQTCLAIYLNADCFLIYLKCLHMKLSGLATSQGSQHTGTRSKANKKKLLQQHR